MLKGKKVISPVCEIRWAHLVTPNVKHNAAGTYSVDLLLDPTIPGHQEFMDTLRDFSEEVFEDHTADMKPKLKEKCQLFLPFKPEEDQDGEHTGRFVMRVKQNRITQRKDGSTHIYKPIIVDSRGKQIPKPKDNIGNGSEMRADIYLMPFENSSGPTKLVGVSAKMNAVQLVKLVAFGGPSFGAIEGGYVADEEDDNETSASPFPDGDDDDL